MGSRPSWPTPVQVSRPVGQPLAGLSSAGVSRTESPGAAQPPWNVWNRPTQCPTSWVRICGRMMSAKAQVKKKKVETYFSTVIALQRTAWEGGEHNDNTIVLFVAYVV
jgi:hypothetical protein